MIIFIIAVLGIYLVWKLMDPGNKKKSKQRKFKIGKHRRKGMDDDDA